MALRFIGTALEHGNCPTLYEAEEPGDIVVQGGKRTDPEYLAQLRDVGEHDTFAVICSGAVWCG
ncbi:MULTISPECIES: hypothetical protein [Streptomyces]|uniref:hypothetical protein n=1 Tax=Streptomyces TaxID=1883 RepID=UPI0004C70E0D|nr:hypothetical protein [Streptomyces sp. PAN_FS17]SEB57993.1 hypothetical protein SAMN05216482_0015 [Streptomyces sp. PAN_FS17]